MDYDKAVSKSLYLDELRAITKALEALSTLPGGVEGEVEYVNNNFDRIAKFWFNTEIEEWMVIVNVKRER